MFFDTLLSAIGGRDGLGFVKPDRFDWNSDYQTTFWWILNTDPQRPNKRSRSLMITIEQEAVQEYRDASEAAQERALRLIREIVATRLESYDPDHAATVLEEAPVERWRIGTGSIF